MIPSLDNFLSFGKDVFIARPDYRAMVLEIYTIAMTNDQLGEMDRVNGCKLIESLLLNVRDHCDDVRAIVKFPYGSQSHSCITAPSGNYRDRTQTIQNTSRDENSASRQSRNSG